MWPELLLKAMEIIWNWDIQIDFWIENWGSYRVFIPQELFFEKFAHAMKDRQEFLDKLENMRFLKRVSSGIIHDVFTEWENWENIPFTKEQAEKELNELIPEWKREFYEQNYL